MSYSCVTFPASGDSVSNKHIQAVQIHLGVELHRVRQQLFLPSGSPSCMGFFNLNEDPLLTSINVFPSLN